MSEITLPKEILDQPMPIAKFADVSVLFTLNFRNAVDANPDYFDDKFMLQNRELLSPELQLVINGAKTASLMRQAAFDIHSLLFPPASPTV